MLAACWPRWSDIGSVNGWRRDVNGFRPVRRAATPGARGNGGNMAGDVVPRRPDPDPRRHRELPPDGLAERARGASRRPHDLLRDLPPDPGVRPAGAASDLARHRWHAVHR